MSCYFVQLIHHFNLYIQLTCLLLLQSILLSLLLSLLLLLLLLLSLLLLLYQVSTAGGGAVEEDAPQPGGRLQLGHWKDLLLSIIIIFIIIMIIIISSSGSSNCSSSSSSSSSSRRADLTAALQTDGSQPDILRGDFFQLPCLCLEGYHHNSVYYNITCYDALYYSTLLYSTRLFSTLLYSSLLLSTLLYSTILYYTLLYYITLYRNIFDNILLVCYPIAGRQEARRGSGQSVGGGQHKVYSSIQCISVQTCIIHYTIMCIICVCVYIYNMFISNGIKQHSQYESYN